MATARQLEHTKTDLYEQDFLAWTEDQAEALRTKQAGALDWENLLEEVESMGRNERNAMESRLSLLLTHLMKWQWQPEKRGKSWMQTIREQRKAIRKILKNSPSLRSHVPEMLAEAWAEARDDAAFETELPLSIFPETCPWSLDTQVLADWMPE
ncbi:MAG: DUF29 domain-containing protein [Gammaproteobacteria bacterium]|nr:DUF29 domain-containing protein [Gammaproteobacteria bacterium]